MANPIGPQNAPPPSPKLPYPISPGPDPTGTLNKSSFSTRTPGKVAVGVASGVFVHVGIGGFVEVGAILSAGGVDPAVGSFGVSAVARGKAVGAVVAAHELHPPVDRLHTSKPRSVISDKLLSRTLVPFIMLFS
ncbi:MAG: hypothetical protein JW918_19440, partial [Anaerolineae bacterium]|nr:hypothetical protein [Anaerolineae bacterium]